MSQIELRFTPVLRTELNVLFTALIFHPQLIQASCSNDVARTVGFRDVINMTGIVKGMGNIRAIRIALMKRNGDFSTLYQREVEAVLVATVRFGKTHRHTFQALTLVIAVSIKLHPVHARRILPGVDIVIFGAGHARHQGTADHRAFFKSRTPATVFVIRHPFPRH